MRRAMWGKQGNSSGRRWSVLASALACTIGLTAGTAQAAEPLPAISSKALEAHVRVLADDKMEGREAGSRGYDSAAQYVAAQFKALGLKPAGNPSATGDAAYLQPVALLGAKRAAEGARFVIHDKGGNTALTYPKDFMPGRSYIAAQTALMAPVVFVGYGIRAPERGHDDYAGLDVRGKIVVMLDGTPKGWPSEIGAHYGSVKSETAAAQGAVGVISVGTRDSEGRRPYAKSLDYVDSESMTWVGADGRPFVKAAQLVVSAVLSPEAAVKLFEGAPQSYAQILDAAEKGAPKGFDLPITVSMAQSSSHRPLKSSNVAAVLEGSDPALKDEYVVLTAHLDHLGIGKPINGDAIYNGALDNATGIATLIETARAFTKSKARPKRSILFVAVTAEEKGLVGADYFARVPTVPRDKMIANVNLDMPVLLYPFKDVVAFGAQHSTLGDTVAKAAAQVNIALSPDPIPEEAVFTRSDHYRFVQQGIPSVFLVAGFQSANPKQDGGKIWMDFLKNRYHRPDDDLKQPIDYKAGALFTQVNFLIARDIANADNRPSWLPGNFFGETFGKTEIADAPAKTAAAAGGSN